MAYLLRFQTDCEWEGCSNPARTEVRTRRNQRDGIYCVRHGEERRGILNRIEDEEDVRNAGESVHGTG